MLLLVLLLVGELLLWWVLLCGCGDRGGGVGMRVCVSRGPRGKLLLWQVCV